MTTKDISIKNISVERWKEFRQIAKERSFSNAELFHYLMYSYEQNDALFRQYHDVPYLREQQILDDFLVVDYQKKQFNIEKPTTAILGILNRKTHEIYLTSALYYPPALITELNNLTQGYHMNKTLQHSYYMNKYEFYVVVFYTEPQRFLKPLDFDKLDDDVLIKQKYLEIEERIPQKKRF